MGMVYESMQCISRSRYRLSTRQIYCDLKICTKLLQGEKYDLCRIRIHTEMIFSDVAKPHSVVIILSQKVITRGTLHFKDETINNMSLVTDEEIKMGYWFLQNILKFRQKVSCSPAR